MLSCEQKKSIIAQYQSNKNDTGMSEVQIALLTARIASLQTHFNTHKKDVHSKRGLLTMVSKRRKLLNYLKLRSSARYHTVISSLGIRK